MTRDGFAGGPFLFPVYRLFAYNCYVEKLDTTFLFCMLVFLIDLAGFIFSEIYVFSGGPTIIVPSITHDSLDSPFVAGRFLYAFAY